MIKLVSGLVVVAVCLCCYYLYFRPPPFPIPADIYKRYPDCSKGIKQCIGDFTTSDANVNDEESFCFSTTVFLHCIFEQCLVVSEVERTELIGPVRQNLLTADFECEFHFDAYSTVCQYTENKCKNALSKRLKNVLKETVCGLYKVYFKCVFDGCPMTTREQKDFIHEFRHALKENGINCFKEFQGKDNIFKYNCTSARNLYECRNGECIHKDFICNGKDNCGDYSDEQFCEFMPPQKSKKFSLKKKRTGVTKDEV